MRTISWLTYLKNYKLCGKHLQNLARGCYRKKAHAVSNGKKSSSLFPSLYPHSTASLFFVIFSAVGLRCVLKYYFFFPLLLLQFPSVSPFFTFSFHYLIPCFHFFSWLHSFLYKLLSVSPSLSLAPPSSSPCQSANSPTAQPVRFRPPSRK